MDRLSTKRQGAGRGDGRGATEPEPRARSAGEAFDLRSAAVLIPALNEEEALPRLLAALPKERLHSVVVADNGSTDDTARVALRAGAQVASESETGYGAACLAGLARLAASAARPTSVVFMDADHPEHAEHVPRLVEALGRGADLALGVRVLPGGAIGNRRLHARWGNAAVLGAARLLFGLRHRDLPPFRAVRFDALEGLAMDDRNWGWTLQMQVRAVQRGLAVREVPVPHLPRRHGRSKISGRLGPSLRVGAAMVRALIRERRRGSGVRPAGAPPRPRRGPPSRRPSRDGR